MDDKIKTYKNSLPIIDTKFHTKYQTPPPKKELPKSKSW